VQLTLHILHPGGENECSVSTASVLAYIVLASLIGQLQDTSRNEQQPASLTSAYSVCDMCADVRAVRIGAGSRADGHPSEGQEGC